MIVHRDRQDALGVRLSDHVVVEYGADVLGRRYPILGTDQGRLVLLTDDVHAKLDAFIADEDRRPRNKFPHFVLALAAERAIQSISGITTRGLAHRYSASSDRERKSRLEKRFALTTRHCHHTPS